MNKIQSIAIRGGGNSGATEPFSKACARAEYAAGAAQTITTETGMRSGNTRHARQTCLHAIAPPAGWWPTPFILAMDVAAAGGQAIAGPEVPMMINETTTMARARLKIHLTVRKIG
ncbi:hypothetical protein GCM10011529_02010 [Polymorphobacter glacialis]|uniref:Uncharacterized protein n=1 Tax=Sandarakinorhabdus glacialis TaxID=1614636 RepID=A0A916ZIF6_9SPHN|nr:hypothetical protein [Polymorphobacter glacialis]GGD99464.1 hypothetical protein GCM10011529_02010 [Polymorphobacter glacialis]